MLSIYSCGWFITLGLLLLTNVSFFCSKGQRRQLPLADVSTILTEQATPPEKLAPVSSATFMLAEIAGDDVMTTQLDLTRAYIDMGDIPLAEELLQGILQQGTASQQAEAKILYAECGRR